MMVNNIVKSFLLIISSFVYDTASNQILNCPSKFRKLLFKVIFPILVSNPDFEKTNYIKPKPVLAAQVEFDFNDVRRLKRGLKELDYLLANWEEKTTYCNFGELKMELLDTKNKDQLIKTARESGLLDKSKSMNVMCKRDPEVVRAFLGLTPENLVLQKADILMKSKNVLSDVNPDLFDEYIESVDNYVQAVASADALAYNARNDYNSANSFEKDSADTLSLKGSKYLDQSKDSVIKVRDSLSKIVTILDAKVD